MSERIYGVATKAWQIVAGCDDRMPCAAKCWAKNTVHRLGCSPNEKVRRFHEGLTVSLDPEMKQFAWTGEVRLNEAHLTDPLRWRKPAVIETGYHGDLFRLPADQIDRVFAVAALCPQHTFLTLTKCAKEMEEYFGDLAYRTEQIGIEAELRSGLDRYQWADETNGECPSPTWELPLPNVFLGFSASNQSEFDARWQYARKLAEQGWKVWCSLEPLIGPVDLLPHIAYNDPGDDGAPCGNGLLKGCVLGGESGKEARPCDVAWLRSLVRQCQDAGVPCFVKQLGAYSFDGSAPLPMTAPCGLKEIENRIALKHSKGADPSEWPEDLRVQELAWEVGR